MLRVVVLAAVTGTCVCFSGAPLSRWVRQPHGVAPQRHTASRGAVVMMAKERIKVMEQLQSLTPKAGTVPPKPDDGKKKKKKGGGGGGGAPAAGKSKKRAAPAAAEAADDVSTVEMSLDVELEEGMAGKPSFEIIDPSCLKLSLDLVEDGWTLVEPPGGGTKLTVENPDPSAAVGATVEVGPLTVANWHNVDHYARGAEREDYMLDSVRLWAYERGLCDAETANAAFGRLQDDEKKERLGLAEIGPAEIDEFSGVMGFVLNYTQTEYEDVVAKLDDPTDEKACAEAWEPYLEARQLFETLVATSLRDAKLSEKEELQAALSAAVADGRLSEADAQLSDEEDEDLSDKLDLARFGIFTGKGGAAADDDDASDDASSMSEALAAGEKSANRVFEDLDESEQVALLLNETMGLKYLREYKGLVVGFDNADVDSMSSGDVNDAAAVGREQMIAAPLPRPPGGARGARYTKGDAKVLTPEAASTLVNAKMDAAWPLAPPDVRAARRFAWQRPAADNAAAGADAATSVVPRGGSPAMAAASRASLPTTAKRALGREALAALEVAAAETEPSALRDWLLANRDWLGWRLKHALTHSKLAAQSRGDWDRARVLRDLRKRVIVADDAATAPLRQLVLDAELRLRSAMGQPDVLDTMVNWAGADVADVSATWTVIRGAVCAWDGRLALETEALRKAEEELKGGQAKLNEAIGASGAKAAADADRAAAQLELATKARGQWAAFAGSFNAEPTLAGRLRPEMAFLSQALAFETTSELSAFAEREFCPAAGMEPGQLRELLRGYVVSLERLEWSKYGELARAVWEVHDQLALGTADELAVGALDALTSEPNPNELDSDEADDNAPYSWQTYALRTDSVLAGGADAILKGDREGDVSRLQRKRLNEEETSTPTQIPGFIKTLFGLEELGTGGSKEAQAANAVRKASTDARQAALTEDASVDDATRDGLLGWFEPGSPIVDEVPVSDDDNGIIGIAYAAKDD